MKSLSDLIVTRRENGMVAALKEENRITELHVEKEKPFRVGNIYVGRVQSIVKNINAAFVDFGCGMNGYLALDRSERFFYTKQARPGNTTCGDELLVQLEKEPVKTKLPVLNGCLNISGRFAVLVHGDSGIVFSRKIRSRTFQEEIRQQIEEKALLPENCALIIRTNAQDADREQIFEEAALLAQRYTELLSVAPYRTCFSCLYRGEHAFLELIRDYPMSSDLHVVTDVREFYQELTEKLPEIPARFYEDPQLSLTALYSLNTAFDQALGRVVWLKSGGYLVLEPTEALTVIDVNTGKCTDKHISREQHFLRTDLEAAREIALQLRLRNYSGIIIVDFIDLESKEHTEELMQCFRQELAKDRVKATLVDMTRLNLAEVTRKRVYRPLHEAVRELNRDAALKEAAVKSEESKNG
ncbi:MAG: ribonuclease E/G [Lachnospiraceae bacterium]|nr:ribonuclease E/G [Lachnospiraceae bacterium]